MQVIQGNILNIQEGIICHQVNCKGVFGAGLAKQIREKYPQAYKHYMGVFNKNSLRLGKTFYGWVSDQVIVYHLPAQYSFGRIGQHTDHTALKECLETVANKLIDLAGMSVYIPYDIGCGLGGGKWEVISQIIEETLPEAIIVKL